MSWTKVTLDCLCTFLSGNAWSASKFKPDGIIPIIRIQNLGNNQNEQFVWWDEPYDNRFVVNKGDLLLSLSGSIKVFIWDGIDALLNQRIVKITPNKDVNFRWLFWQISDIILEIERMGKWALVNNVSITDLRNIQIPLPPLPVQKRIAEILDAADALRRKDQELLKKYDELAQAIFIDMFGDPVRNEKGWEIKKLGLEIKKIRYGTGSPPKYSENGIPFIRATNIKKGSVVEKGMVYISLEEARKIEKCYINEGDLIIVRSGANTGDCAYISSEYSGCLAGYDLIIEMDKVKSRFYNFLINSKWGKAIIDKLSRRAGQPHLNSEQVCGMEFISPSYEKLQIFKTAIDEIDSLRGLSNLTYKKNLLLFNTLLQKAFTGELVA